MRVYTASEAAAYAEIRKLREQLECEKEFYALLQSRLDAALDDIKQSAAKIKELDRLNDALIASYGQMATHADRLNREVRQLDNQLRKVIGDVLSATLFYAPYQLPKVLRRYIAELKLYSK